MQLKHMQSLTQPGEGIVKVTALCWAPSGKKLAICTTDRVVVMFDDEGNRRDRFSTKPADKGPKNYVVRDMVFSPQSDKLAIAQSDNMIYVYKLGLEWGEKKSICNKYANTSPVTCLAWPSKRPNELVFGLAEGKVRLGQMKVHKSPVLYSTESYVTAMCCNSAGNAIVAAHLDGSIYTCWFDGVDRGAHVIAHHPCVPFALTWGTSIVVGGNDCQITFYDEDGGEEHSFDYSSDPQCHEFTVASANPTGDAVVVGNFDSLYVFTRNKDTMGWEEKGITRVENMYTVTTLGWKCDGDKLAVGNITGIVDLYDVCVKRVMHKGGFELTYVSHSQVIVRQVDTNTRIVVRSQYNCEIVKTNIYKNRYVVATTTDTLLLGDMETLKLSEIQWRGNGTEKLIFDTPTACVIYFAGEISIVEYGVNEILGSIRTSHINSYVLSLRINERPTFKKEEEQKQRGWNDEPDENKKVAYLLDSHTVCIKDLSTQASVSISHDSKIDFLELNGRARFLLFRDKRRHLHLYNLETQSRHQLLSYCTYVQWVPNSDVVVGQNRNSLCVWYNIRATDQVTNITIKGDVEDIERSDGKTEVIVDEGLAQAVYQLDESLIEFGTAVDDCNSMRAMDILAKLELTSESEAMWRQLLAITLKSNELHIAQRCAAAVGDVSMSRYLNKVNTEKVSIEADQHGEPADDHYSIRSKMSLLHKDLKMAEDELLVQGKVDACIEMYQRLYKYSDAIRVAEQNRHPATAEMSQEYYQYLLDTNQEEGAAELKVKEQDYIQAISLYLKGGLPAKAAQILINNDIQQPTQLLEQVATALTRCGMHDRAGEFYERLQELSRALESYVRGNAFRKAVELARRNFPARVVELQEQWGDHLVSHKQIDMAINHYIEAKALQKAIEAALSARQYSRALQLLDAIDNRESSKPYYKQLAKHYEDANNYEMAEKCYVDGGAPQLAVEMHTRLGHWEVAHKIAMGYMSEGEVGLLYINQAQKLESQGKLRDAEKLYLTVKEKDLAINMYKKHRRFEDMVRLVQDYRPDLLKETHQFLAQTLEMEGAFTEAEQHYIGAQEWHSAVNMYRSNELWDDAIRVAKFYGGQSACKRVTIALLMAVGVTEGSKFLLKHALVEAAIDHAAETSQFELALELANLCMTRKLADVHLKHALFLEDEEHFQEAEEEFIKASKPKEAIDMWVHQQEWGHATRVAEAYEPAAVSDVYISQAQVKLDGGDFKGAEELYLVASQPDLALQMYQQAERWQDALRIAQMHLPHKVAEVSMAYQGSQARAGKGGASKSDYLSTGRSLEQSRQWAQAIDTYLGARAPQGDEGGLNEIVELWERAIHVARGNVPNRHVEVSLEVSRRLVEVKRDEAAADILFEVGRHEEAVNVCLAAQCYDKAKALAQGHPTLKKKVNDAYVNRLVDNEDTTELVDIGRAEVALDVAAKRGDWDKVWDVATKMRLSPSVVGKYVLMRIDECVKKSAMNQGLLDEAVRTLQKRQGPATPEAVPIYERLGKALLGRTVSQETAADHVETMSVLRDSLHRLGTQYRQQRGVDDKLQGRMETVLMATHYQSLLYTAKSMGLKEIYAKCAITLLKYPTVLPQDKALYQAGNAAREQGNNNLAFMLLNRYVAAYTRID